MTDLPLLELVAERVRQDAEQFLLELDGQAFFGPREADPRREPDPKQRCLTFIHNQAQVIVAYDFSVVVTATFRTLYVFVIVEYVNGSAEACGASASTS